jgi:hypothetical protein
MRLKGLLIGAAVITLGLVLYYGLPPQPRWSLRGRFVGGLMVPGTRTCFMMSAGPEEFRGPAFFHDLDTGAEVGRVIADGRRIYNADLSADHRYLAATLDDPRELCCVDLVTRAEKRCALPNATNYMLRVSRTGALLVLEDPPQTTIVYDTRKLEPLARFENVEWLLAEQGDVFVAGPLGSGLHDDPPTIKRLIRVTPQGKTEVPFSPVGKWFGASADGRVLIAGVPGPKGRGPLHAWDTISGKHIAAIPGRFVLEHDGAAVHVFADGQAIAALAGDDEVKIEVWNVPRGTRVRRIEAAGPSMLQWPERDCVVATSLTTAALAFVPPPDRAGWQREWPGEWLQAASAVGPTIRVNGELDRILGLDPEMGATQFTVPVGPGTPPVLTPGLGTGSSGFALIQEISASRFIVANPGGRGTGVMTGLLDWLGLAGFWGRSATIRVFDRASGNALDTVRVSVSADPDRPIDVKLHPDGDTMIVSRRTDDGTLLECWDIPARRRWGWIIGIPLVFGGVLAMKLGRAKP